MIAICLRKLEIMRSAVGDSLLLFRKKVMLGCGQCTN